MTTTRKYDSANRPRQIETGPWTLTSDLSSPTSGLFSFTYDYNLADQGTRARAWLEHTRWDYTYDALGEVTSGLKRWPDSTLVAGA